MATIHTAEDLQSIIKQLEKNQTNEWELVKEQFLVAIDHLKPTHLIKSTLQELTADKEFNHEIIDRGIGMAAGYLSKKIAVGKSDNPGKQLLGNALEWGVSRFVSRHTDGIKSVVMRFIHSLTKDKKDERAE